MRSTARKERAALDGSLRAPRPKVAAPALTLWFDELTMEDLPKVGGKNASLGVLSRDLAFADIPVPVGFAVTTEAFRQFLRANALEGEIRDRIERMQRGSLSREEAGEAIREAIRAGVMPAPVREAIARAYRALVLRVPARPTGPTSEKRNNP